MNPAIKWLPRIKELAALAGAALVLGACAGGASGSEDGAASRAAEEALVDYVECLREQGLDVPDPQVDADGNLVLNPGDLFPDEQSSEADIEAFRDKFEAAQEVCGSPPEGAVGGFEHGGDQTDFQDALLEFARCMRAEGVDIADPDFSGGGQGRFFAEFHQLEENPAFEPCQQKAFGALGGGGG